MTAKDGGNVFSVGNKQRPFFLESVVPIHPCIHDIFSSLKAKERQYVALFTFRYKL